MTTPDNVSIQDVDRVLGILEAEQRVILGLVINRLRPDLVRRKDMLSPDEILDALSIRLIGIVPEDEDVLIGNGRGMPAAHNDGSLTGKAYLNIARRVMGEDPPFIPILKGRRGLLARLGIGKRS